MLIFLSFCRATGPKTYPFLSHDAHPGSAQLYELWLLINLTRSGQTDSSIFMGLKLTVSAEDCSTSAGLELGGFH